jgi:hypothetical protein
MSYQGANSETGLSWPVCVVNDLPEEKVLNLPISTKKPRSAQRTKTTNSRKERRMKIKFHIVALIALTLALTTATVSAAPVAGPAGLNARFIDWPEKSNVIHIFGYADNGRPSQPVAIVKEGQWVLFGFEWTEETVEATQEFVDKPEHDITLSVDGGDPFSVKDGYQGAFEAVPHSGPSWSWDHDGDGLGDGNGNGVGDWDGPILFFRYQYSGLSVGTHTFEFTIIDPEYGFSNIITVEVVAEE